VIDVSEIERAIIGKLTADPELTSYVPDGVYWDLAVQGSTQFVIVSASTSRAEMEFHGIDSWRALIYTVKAVVQSTGTPVIAQADARINALLDRQPLELPEAAGAGLMVMRWLDRVRYTENVDGNTWQHRGARYEVIVTPVTGAPPPVAVPPTLTFPPVGSSVASGQSVTLTVVAAGTPPLAYQWIQAGVDIPGATNAFYVTGPLTTTSVYAVRVSNLYGTVTSAPVTVTVVAATLTYQQQVIVDGAVAYWPLDDASGSTARDVVGTRHGTIVGGVTLNQSGMGTSRSMSFDGSSGHISLPALPPFYPAYSYEAWVYLVTNSDNGIVIQRGNAGAAGHGLHGVASNLRRIFFDGYPVLPNTVSTTSVPLSSWHHYVWANDGTVLRFYVDGVFTNQAAMVLPVEGPASPINEIGTYSHTAGGWMHGKLQDIAIYTRVLTPAEIAVHYDLRA